MLDTTKIPKHVAIIMDGNRRWAKKQGMNILKGHEYAVNEVVENLIESAGEMGVEYLTMWAFSTENWGRAEDEVTGLMNLFRKALMTKVDKFIAKGARLKMIGDMSKFSPDIQEGMMRAMEKSAGNTKITVTFALNYGGRDEIVRVIKKLTNEQTNKLTQESFSEYLDTAGMPDPDLIIRTGGEQRLSGFLMWQSAYSELYFTDTLFPDFDKDKLEEAVEEYQSRQRRFGK
ncbi:di-trans,poly-cis-decaprenylcistransferase [Candidatus Woesebacteria bacterium]|nr:di-trans,poly-cis-decaprenylcistransferase [Candidatus Woesebacteria bacterium]